MNSNKKLYGWFSKTQKEFAENFRAIDQEGKLIKYKIIRTIYLDMNNNEVEVTKVSGNKIHKSFYDDCIYVGELSKISENRNR